MNKVAGKEHAMLIGRICKRVRRMKKLGVREVAKRINISYATYSKIERGELGLTVDRMFDICRALEIDVVQLVRHVKCPEYVLVDGVANLLTLN